MFGILFRLLWRFLVLVLAIALAYLTAFVAFPYLDDHINIILAIIILYLGLAYVAIPALFRFWRVVFKPNHVPHYATTGDGWASDPVNIAIVTRNKRHLVRAMKKAGWEIADKATLRNSVREAWALLFNRSYPRAPMSSLYLFGRKQDIGFQIQTGDPPTPRHRHHVRFWRVYAGKTHHHNSFWRELMGKFFSHDRQVWIGAATHDVGPFAIRWRTGQITHKIDEDTNNEREYLIGTLDNTSAIKSVSEVKAGERLEFRGQTIGINIEVDGYLKVLELKPLLLQRRRKEALDLTPVKSSRRK